MMADGDNDLIVQRDALAAELAGLIHRAELAERVSTDTAVLQAAIAQADRDRDALSSPTLEDLRNEVDSLSDGVESCWSSIAYKLGNCAKVADRYPAVPVPDRLVAAIVAVEQARADIIDRLGRADIDYVRPTELGDRADIVRDIQGKQSDGTR